MDMTREETTFHKDFRIAEAFGKEAVLDTYRRAMAEWKDDYRYLTDLVLTLNERCWGWYDEYRKNHGVMEGELTEVYRELFYEAQAYALDNLKGQEFRYFYSLTD